MEAELSAELEAALVRELRRCYALENWMHFGERLKMPVIALETSTGMLGRWVNATRTLELSRTMVLERAWPEVMGVLEHEMAHQFVDEVLRVTDESAHGETFRNVCAERGIDARAGGVPVASSAPMGEGAKALDRIRKLLALAASSSQHEAELAMRKAHELMLRHNIDQLPIGREHEVRWLGEPKRRTNGVEAEVVGLLAEFFFVEVIAIPVYLPRTGTHARVYEITGTHANLEMASHVYAFLLATAERLWHANRGDARVRSGRDRLSYQTGVIRGFREKLSAERVELRGVGLVWAGDKTLETFYRRRHPRIVRRRRTVRVGGAHAAGREAGHTVVLHKPVSDRPSGGSPRLLRGG